MELEQTRSFCEGLKEENQILRVQIGNQQNNNQRCLKPNNIPMYDSRIIESESQR